MKQEQVPKDRVLYSTGFESGFINDGSGLNVFVLSRHVDMWESDLERVKADGIQLLRYPICWDMVEKIKGEYDWSFYDKALSKARELGIELIVDPLHLVSIPEWLSGFLDPTFPPAYYAFVEAFARRYSWITKYTVINEPWSTTKNATCSGIWKPWIRGGNHHYWDMLFILAKIYVEVSHMLMEIVPNVEFFHMEMAYSYHAEDNHPETLRLLEEKSSERFLFTDLILGRIHTSHREYQRCIHGGISIDRLEWFQHNNTRIDVFGLDYYVFSDEGIVNGISCFQDSRDHYYDRNPKGFFALLKEYAQYYKGIINAYMIGETNFGSSITDKITFLKCTSHNAEKSLKYCNEENIIFWGYCWFCYRPATDWQNCLTRATGDDSVNGLYRTDESFPWWHENRKALIPSELSDVFSALAKGEITSKDIRAYIVSPNHRNGWLKFFVETLMCYVDECEWIDPEHPQQLSMAA